MSTRFRPEDTRQSYDLVAREYADAMAGELAGKPFDRDFLDAIAAAVAAGGKAVELGCGSGQIAAYLHGRGVDISGLDLSPLILEEARRLFPSIDFVVGDMLDLPFEDSSFAAVVSFYSIVHFDDVQLDRAIDEMARVLAPGGLVAIAFHIGDVDIHRVDWLGKQVSLDFRHFPTAMVEDSLRRAGLSMRSTHERDPYPPGVEYQSRRAYLVAERRPDGG